LCQFRQKSEQNFGIGKQSPPQTLRKQGRSVLEIFENFKNFEILGNSPVWGEMKTLQDVP